MKFYRPAFCWESRDVLLARQRRRDRRQRWLTVFLVLLLLAAAWYLAWVF